MITMSNGFRCKAYAAAVAALLSIALCPAAVASTLDNTAGQASHRSDDPLQNPVGVRDPALVVVHRSSGCSEPAEVLLLGPTIRATGPRPLACPMGGVPCFSAQRKIMFIGCPR